MNQIQLYEDAINTWASREHKGCGTILVPPPFVDKALVLRVLQKIYIAHPLAKCLIVCEKWNERQELIEYITNQEDIDNNNEFKKLINDKFLKIYTTTVTNRIPYFDTFYLTIFYRPLSYTNTANPFILGKSKFKLVVFNQYPNSELYNQITQACPMLTCFEQHDVDRVRTTLPVEESRIGVELPEGSEAERLLRYYDEYISTSISIFGSFDVMEQCRQGNASINVSSAQICQQIAEENGWNDHLDMSADINRQLDELFNPGNIRERASKTYEIIRDRNNFLSDYEGKFEQIYKIIKENEDKSILVINKRGDFANKVTDYINKTEGRVICGNHHPKIESLPAVDIDGKPLFYKSGDRKGERKFMGEQYQKSLNEKLFNLGRIRVLSLNNKPDKDLQVTADIIIITSPQCEEIKNYLYRLSNLYVSAEKLKLYTIYVKNSIEEQRLSNKTLSENHTLINEINTNIYENNSQFVIVE